jgi:hypothetical protein
MKDMAKKHRTYCKTDIAECRKVPWLKQACAVHAVSGYDESLNEIFKSVLDTAVTTPETAKQFTTEVLKCSSGRGYGQFLAVLKVLELLEENAWDSSPIISWLNNRSITAPDSKDLEPILDVTRLYLAKEHHERQKRSLKVLVALAEASASWYRAKKAEVTNKKNAYDWMVAASAELAPAGKLESIVPVFEQMPTAESNSDDLLIWVVAAYCEKYAFEGQTGKCTALLNRMAGATVGGKFWGQQLAVVRARNLYYQGTFPDAVNEMKKAITSLEAVKERVVHDWALLLLAEAQMDSGDVAGAQGTLNKQRQLVGNAAAETTLDKALSRSLEIKLATKRGDFAQAAKSSRALEVDLQRDVNGVTKSHFWNAFDGVAISALSADVETTAKSAATAEKFLAELPDLKALAPLISALLDAKKGTYKAQNLEPLEKKLGKNFPLITRTEAYIQQISAKK